MQSGIGPFGIGFILLLLTLGGFAAYQGDRVGMIVGKRRLSLFGIRPKYFSRIVSVLTGILIVTLTMIGVLLVSETAQKAILGIEALQSELLELTGQVDELKLLQSQLQTENDSLRTENEALHRENLELAALNQELSNTRDELIQINEELQEQQEMLELAISDLIDSRGLAEYTYDLLLQAQLLYLKGDVIGNYTLQLAPDRDANRKEVERVLSEVSERLFSEGAGFNPWTGRAISLERVFVVGGTMYIYSEEEHIEDIVDALVEAYESGVDGVVIQVIADRHAPVGQPVRLDFNFFVNTRVYEAGEVVAERVFDGRKPGGLLFDELLWWLRSEVPAAARSRGLIGQPDGTVTGPISPGTLFDVVNEIIVQRREAVVQAVAASETWTSDELELAFRVIPRYGVWGYE